jgi:hypothetical protein
MAVDFSKYLNGNPAMLEIWSDALNRIEAQVELAPVQIVVVREWLVRATARRNQLQLESQKGMLPDEKYAELATLDNQIKNIEISLKRFG